MKIILISMFELILSNFTIFTNFHLFPKLTFDSEININRHGCSFGFSLDNFRMPPYIPIWHDKYSSFSTSLKLKASPNFIGIVESFRTRCFLISMSLSYKISCRIKSLIA